MIDINQVNLILSIISYLASWVYILKGEWNKATFFIGVSSFLLLVAKLIPIN